MTWIVFGEVFSRKRHIWYESMEWPTLEFQVCKTQTIPGVCLAHLVSWNLSNMNLAACILLNSARKLRLESKHRDSASKDVQSLNFHIDQNRSALSCSACVRIIGQHSAIRTGCPVAHRAASFGLLALMLICYAQQRSFDLILGLWTPEDLNTRFFVHFDSLQLRLPSLQNWMQQGHGVEAGLCWILLVWVSSQHGHRPGDAWLISAGSSAVLAAGPLR